MGVSELGEDGQSVYDHLSLALFGFVRTVVSNQDIAIEIDALHFSLISSSRGDLKMSFVQRS